MGRPLGFRKREIVTVRETERGRGCEKERERGEIRMNIGQWFERRFC